MTEDHACTLFPLLLAIFLSNAVAAGIWALHGAGCLTSPRAAVSDFIWVTQVLTGCLKVDSALVCASGAVGITASCIVLQYGSIQLVQVCAGQQKAAPRRGPLPTIAPPTPCLGGPQRRPAVHRPVGLPRIGPADNRRPSGLPGHHTGWHGARLVAGADLLDPHPLPHAHHQHHANVPQRGHQTHHSGLSDPSQRFFHIPFLCRYRVLLLIIHAPRLSCETSFWADQVFLPRSAIPLPCLDRSGFPGDLEPRPARAIKGPT